MFKLLQNRRQQQPRSQRPPNDPEMLVSKIFWGKVNQIHDTFTFYDNVK